MNTRNSGKMKFDMNWKEHYQKKRVSPKEAARVVQSGDIVYIPLQGPRIIHHEIAKRRKELREVEIHLARPGIAQAIDFASEPGWESSFNLENELFIGDGIA